jgi:virginiamycin B lyase
MGGVRIKIAIVVAAIAATMLTVAGAADAAIYWPDYGQVSRMNVDGSVLQEEFIPRPATIGGEEIGCAGVAVTASHIYWAIPSDGAIAAANLDGSEPNYAFITGLANPCGVAVDSTSIYWTEFEGGTIGRANLAGGEVERGFVGGLKRPCGVAVAGGWLYWTGEAIQSPDSYVERRPLAGGIAEAVYTSPVDETCGVAVDSEHVYWGGFGQAIGRARLDGSEPEPSFIAGLDRPEGIALYGGDIYWSQNDPAARSIEAAELGGDPRPHRVLEELPRGVPEGIAVDSVVVPPPAPAPPVYEIGFGRQHHARRSPVTYVPVEFPHAGTFSVAAPRSLRWRVVGLTPRSDALPSAGRWLLRVTPAPGRAGAALRRRLARRGKAWAAIKIHFRSADAIESTGRARLSLVAPRSR